MSSSPPTLEKLSSLRSSLQKSINLTFTGPLMEWRKPEANRVAYSIDDWPLDKLQNWERQTLTKWQSIYPQFDSYFDSHKQFYADSASSSQYYPSYCEESDNEAEMKSLPEYLGHSWWDAYLYIIEQKVKKMQEKRKQKVDQYKDKMASNGDDNTSAEGEGVSSSPSSVDSQLDNDGYSRDLSILNPIWCDDKDQLKQFCRDLYWNTAVLESIGKNSPVEAKKGNAVKDAATATVSNTASASDSSVPLIPERVEPLTQLPYYYGKYEILRYFRNNLLFLLYIYENWRSEAYEQLVSNDEGPWTRKVKTQFESLYNLYETWQDQLGQFKKYEQSNGKEQGSDASAPALVYLPIDPEIESLMSRVQQRIQSYSWNEDGRGWSIETVALLRDFRSYDLQNSPKPLEYFYTSIGPFLSVQRETDLFSGFPYDIPFHNDAASLAQLVLDERNGVNGWSRDQWRKFSWDLDPKMRQLRDQWKVLKAALVNTLSESDCSVAESAFCAIKANVFMWENAGNDYWWSDRFVDWSRTAYFGASILHVILSRYLDLKHWNESEKAMENKRKSMMKEEKKEEKGADQVVQERTAAALTEKLDKLLQLAVENKDLHEKGQELTNQAIQAVINAEMTGFPSCILILPSAPRVSVEEKLKNMKEFLFETSQMHVLCEFMCCREEEWTEDAKAKPGVEWHMTEAGGLPLQRVKHKEFVQKAGKIVQGTLTALHVAARLGSILGIHLSSTTGQALEKVNSLIAEYGPGNLVSRMMDHDENSASPGVPKRLTGEGLDLFREISGIPFGQDRSVVAGLTKVPIRRTGPMGNAGNFYWLCPKHASLVNWWNDNESGEATAEELWKRIRKMRGDEGHWAEPQNTTTETAEGAAKEGDKPQAVVSTEARVSMVEVKPNGDYAIQVATESKSSSDDNGGNPPDQTTVELKVEGNKESGIASMKLSVVNTNTSEPARAEGQAQPPAAAPSGSDKPTPASPSQHEKDQQLMEKEHEDDKPVRGCCGSSKSTKKSAKVAPIKK